MKYSHRKRSVCPLDEGVLLLLSRLKEEHKSQKRKYEWKEKYVGVYRKVVPEKSLAEVVV